MNLMQLIEISDRYGASESISYGEVSFNRSLVCETAPALRMLYANDGMATAAFYTNKDILKLVSNKQSFDECIKCEDEPLFIEIDCDFTQAYTEHEKKYGYKPKIAAVKGLGIFVLKEHVINNRKAGRLEGRIALVTGGAQGFGKGLAEAMAAEGAYIVVADLNKDGAEACARELNEKYGTYKAIAVGADVTNAESVENMVEEAVLCYGGLDILISNAGVLVAGSLHDLTEKSFDLVTDVNYKGYFLCAKYASKPMKIQNKYSPEYLTDIIEINSKSGLEGSNKNFAYAGSKFGGIGLTQSFAMELIEYGIKVNAICPGNLLDGSLWSDPSTGLFKQYLDSGKVPGAKTITDVRKYYEDRVPMKRGCTIIDVARAIFYVVEQQYETGQAIPVTGGQVMLK